MLYFAYGSNLDPDQMRSRCPGSKVVGLAALRDHKLSFPLTSHDWGGGVAGIAVAHGQAVWGVVYDLTDDDLKRLDTYEHYVGPGDQHNLYDRDQVFVDLTRADDGSFPRRIRTWIYVPRQANPAKPSRRYLDAILKGAKFHKLPDEYIAVLAKIAVAPEPEPEQPPAT